MSVRLFLLGESNTPQSRQLPEWKQRQRIVTAAVPMHFMGNLGLLQLSDHSQGDLGGADGIKASGPDMNTRPMFCQVR